MSAFVGNIAPYLAAVTPWCQVVQVPYPESGKRLSRESGKSRDQMSDIKFNYFSTNSNQARLEGSEIERERVRERARDTERERVRETRREDERERMRERERG